MPSTSSLSALFDRFLFATVCEERDAMPLSVISALARLDLDPWTEAAELARMPPEGAVNRLTALLAGVIKSAPAQPDRATISARLVALLPATVKAEAPSAGQLGHTLTLPQSQAIRIVWLACLAAMALSVLLSNLTPGARPSNPTTAPTTAVSAHR